MNSYILETYAGFEHCREEASLGLCLSTSPRLVELLGGQGVRVENLERGVAPGEYDRLAKAGYDFTFPLLERFNELCPWRGCVDLRLCFAFGLNNCFFPIFYKALLMQRALDANPDGVVHCVGDPSPVRPKRLQLLYGLYDNLYARLAEEAGLERVALVRHVDDPEALSALDDYSRNRRLGVHEKVLSILNNSPSSFCAKLFGNVRRRGWFPFRHLRLFPWGGKHTVYFHRDCELLDEMFLGLLGRGVRLGRMDRLPVCPDGPGAGALEDAPALERLVLDACAESVRGQGFQPSPLFEAAARLVATRLLTVLGNLKAGLPGLLEGFEAVNAAMRPEGVVFSNALTGPEACAFYCFCREKGRRVAAFEHGLVYGLSEWDSWCARHAGMLTADMGVYHSRRAAKAVASHAPHQRQVVAGLPRVTARMVLPGVQRLLARRWLSLGGSEHVVFYLAGLERNNYVYGPHMENDLEQHERLYASVRALAEVFPASRVVVKLYPSARYVDRMEYEDLAALENVLVVRDVDFRFIRAAADIIFLSSAQSTLGWALGAGVPVVLLEPGHAPSRLAGFPAGDPGVPGVSRAHLLSMNQVVEPARYGSDFYKELFS